VFSKIRKKKGGKKKMRRKEENTENGKNEISIFCNVT